MEIRPANKGSSGEGEGTMSESEWVEIQTAWSGCMQKEKL